MHNRIGFLVGSIAALLLLVGFIFRELLPLPSRQTSQQTQWPTRRQLWESVYRHSGMPIVYPAAPEKTAADYREYYKSLPRANEWFRQNVLSDAEFPQDSLDRKPVSLIGALGSNRVLQRLLPDLPIKLLKHGFHFRGQNYTASDDVVFFIYPNPKNPTQLLTVLTGNSDEAILKFLQTSSRRLRQMSDYYVVQQGRVMLLGFFKDTGEGAWRPEAGRLYDLRASEKAAKTTQHFAFVTHGQNFSAAEIDKLAARYEASLSSLAARLAVPNQQLAALSKLTIHLWDSAEEKGMFTGNTDLRHLDKSRNEAHLLWLPELRGDDFFAEANWFVQALLGESKSAALQEGLAAALTEQWRGSGYSSWAARLVQTQNAPPLFELFDAEIGPMESELARQPLLGSFVETLLEKFGAEEFAKLYRSWPESGVPAGFPQNETWEKLVAAWQNKMRAMPPIPLRFSRPQKIAASDFLRGFCYAHEGYQIYNGYLGSQSREALAKLTALGVNAISITPFGFLRDPNRPAFPGRSGGPNGESDESVIIAKDFAKAHGMAAMLKPHIWMGRGWPGDIKMATPAEWKIFFNHYDRWMRGYAALAEMHGFDMLCVGVELTQATIGHEREWREMIRRWRGIYSGPMVYAANWGHEFESLKFWEALDAIGIDCYYPLSEKENPTDAELLSGAQMVADKIKAVAQKFNQPVLITEIGFCSAAQTWKNPHREDRRDTVDLEAQRRCYEAIYQAFSKSNDWLAGIYWWKWPSTLEDGGAEDNQFTPNGKPAAALVVKWYKQIARESTVTGQ